MRGPVWPCPLAWALNRTMLPEGLLDGLLKADKWFVCLCPVAVLYASLDFCPVRLSECVMGAFYSRGACKSNSYVYRNMVGIDSPLVN